MTKETDKTPPVSDDEMRTILAPVGESREQRREENVRRNFWAKVRKVGRSIPFLEDVVAAYYCATDSRTPASARATIFAALAYFIAPIDLIPDILVFVGLGDDIAVLTAVISTLRSHMTEDHYDKARQALSDTDGT